MQWIRELGDEDVEFDAISMRKSWKTIAKPRTDKELAYYDSISPIETFVNDGKTASFCNFGLMNVLRRHLPFLVKATFPNGGAPPAPHLRVEMWTDGVELCRTGIENNLWPVAITVVSIGATHDGMHVFVPPWARKVLTIALFLGSNKPAHPEVLLRHAVKDLKLLDPRERSDRPDVEESEAAREIMTVTLIRFLADCPARCLAKFIMGHTSTFLCEKCVLRGHNVGTSAMCIWQVQRLDLRVDDLFLTYENHAKKVSSIRNIPWLHV